MGLLLVVVWHGLCVVSSKRVVSFLAAQQPLQVHGEQYAITQAWVPTRASRFFFAASRHSCGCSNTVTFQTKTCTQCMVL